MTAHYSNTRIYGIVPAAGLGRRMDRPKQVLPFRGTTMVGRIVRTLLDAELDGVVVVTRSDLIGQLDLPGENRVRIAINDNAESQMIDSIRIGLSTWIDCGVLPGTTGTDDCDANNEESTDAGVLVVPGDMPGLSVAACRLCLNAFCEQPKSIIVATHGGQRGHPLIFPAALCPDVRALEGGLNLLVQRYSHRVSLIETNDRGVIEDVDTWEQYRSQSSDSRK